jgi:hypothetical protein
MPSKKQLKKLPYQLALLLLTTGASLILGFLSFGGMFALWPVLPLAFGAFALSVAYEGEIYLQNIKGAIHKLFKYNYLQRQVTREYLLEHFPDTSAEDCPQFFKDYEAQLHLLNQFGDKALDKASRKQKKHIEKTLKDMEKWFAIEFFKSDSDTTIETGYGKELKNWLTNHNQPEWKEKFGKRSELFNRVKVFSVLSGLFMGLGTTYLLVEAFTVIPVLSAISLATWPVIIVPMSIIAGAAYGLLTYNAVTDMINNNTLATWYHKIRNDLSKGITPKSVFMAATATLLVGLALALTICTAGTWWTVVKETKPLFKWMGRMPGFIMGVINPIVTGLSAVVFNLQNTSETLEMIADAVEPAHGEDEVVERKSFFESLRQTLAGVAQRENLGQMLNPFRLLLKLTLTPLRVVLFLGHLVSIAVTADRVPGISQTTSALLGLISEGFEDGHYFIPHGEHHHHHDMGTKALLEQRYNEEGGHSHDDDLPTRFLKVLFSPVYLMAAGWDYAASQFNSGERCPMSMTEAWDKQRGAEREEAVTLTSDAQKPSESWHREQAVFRIERHKQKQLQGAWFGQDVARDKCEKLTEVQANLRQASPDEVQQTLMAVDRKPFARHRFFNDGQTETNRFLDELPSRVAAP